VAGKSYLSGGIQMNSGDEIDFGNSNQYITAVNDTSLTLATGGSATLTATHAGNVGIGTTSPSSKLHVAGEITTEDQINFKNFGGSLLKFTKDSWTSVPTQDLIYQSWDTTVDDYIYLKAPGNTTTTHGVALIGDGVIALGRTDAETGAPELTSAAAPLSDNWLVLNSTGATFDGDVTVGPKSNATVSVSESGGADVKMRAGSVGRVGTYSNHDFVITQNGSDALTIDTSRDATFAGDVTLSGTAPTIRIQDSRNLNNPDWDSVSLGNIEFYTSDTTSPGARVLAEIEAFSNNAAASGPNADLIFKTSAIADSSPQTRLTIGYDGTATFTGNIVVSGTVDNRDVATDGTKLDTIATNADVTPSWVPSSDPSYLTSLPSHNHDDRYYTETESDARYAALSHNHAASSIVTGTLADGRISESSVTQHEAALTITEGQLPDDMPSDKVKQICTTHHNFFMNSSSTSADFFVPFNNLNESSNPTNAQYYNRMVAPYNGRIVKVVLHTTAAIGTSCQVLFWVATSAGVFAPSAAETVTGVNLNTANTSATATFSTNSTAQFSAEDVLGVSIIKSSSATANMQVTVVWEYTL
jgi:hypothetical protein